MEAGASWKLTATNNKEISRTLYFYKGDRMKIEGETVAHNHLVILKSDENISMHNGNTDAYLLILEGKPINEPVAQYGPFVMNTEAEIQEAFSDYKRTQFGGWPWPDQEQVHDKNKGRFALHADGTEELK